MKKCICSSDFMLIFLLQLNIAATQKSNSNKFLNLGNHCYLGKHLNTYFFFFLIGTETLEYHRIGQIREEAPVSIIYVHM